MEGGGGQVRDPHPQGQAQGPVAGHQGHPHHHRGHPHHQEVAEVDLHGLVDRQDHLQVQQDREAGLQLQERLQAAIHLRAGVGQVLVQAVQEEAVVNQDPGLVWEGHHLPLLHLQDHQEAGALAPDLHQVAIRSRLGETQAQGQDIQNKHMDQHQIPVLQNLPMEDLLGRSR